MRGPLEPCGQSPVFAVRGTGLEGPVSIQRIAGEIPNRQPTTPLLYMHNDQRPSVSGEAEKTVGGFRFASVWRLVRWRVVVRGTRPRAAGARRRTPGPVVATFFAVRTATVK